MAFGPRGTLLFRRFTPARRTAGDLAFFAVNLTGEFPSSSPGRVTRRASATFTHRVRVDAVGSGPIDRALAQAGGQRRATAGTRRARKSSRLPCASSGPTGANSRAPRSP